ncbi:MAG: siroheme synthase [Sphingomonadales bacterium]|nr:siroheme synthase [Sphingomonadales bacterium]
MHSLPIFLILKDRPVILVGHGDAAKAKRLLLERAGARIVNEQEQAALAIVAVDDESEALAAIFRLKARGVLVNATDRPEHCDFTLPAIVDREPVIVAIGTGGASAGLAKALRQKLEQLLPQSLGSLAEGLRRARSSIRERWPEPDARRRAIDSALDAGGLLDPLMCIGPDAIAEWLESPDENWSRGLRVVLVSSDDPDHLTLQQARLLGQADMIVYGADIAPAIIARGRADAVRRFAEVPPDPLPNGLIVQIVREVQ